MRTSFIFLLALTVAACSTSKHETTAAPKKEKQAYQVKLSRYVLARPPEHYRMEADKPLDELTAYSAWVAQYPQMAELSIWSGFFKEGNCEIAIQDANKDGRYNGVNADYIHLLHPKEGFSDWSDLNSNSIVMKAVNYFKANNTYYSVKVVENNGAVLMIETVDSVTIDRCMYFPEEVPANKVVLQEIGTNRTVSLKAIATEGKKKFTVINFWATYCEPCISKIPTINELSNYATVVNICTNAERYDGNIGDFIKQKNLMGVHCRTDSDAERLFCKSKLPFLAILDEHGNIIQKPDTAAEALLYLKKG